MAQELLPQNVMHYPRFDLWSHRLGYDAFSNPQIAWTFWRALRAVFPEAIAAVLMPNHYHLVLLSDPSPKTLQRIAAFAHGWTRTHLPGARWVGTPYKGEPVSDAFHFATIVRYVALNPCRKGLVRDPLEWPWSTYRGLIGAEARPWVPVNRVRELVSTNVLRKLLNEAGDMRWIELFHRFVSTDPSVSAKGTPLPRKSKRLSTGLAPLCVAATSALGLPPEAIHRRCSPARRLVAHFAHQMDWEWNAKIAKQLKLTPSTVRYHLRRPVPSAWLEAATLCLSDTRLRAPGPSAFDRNSSK